MTRTSLLGTLVTIAAIAAGPGLAHAKVVGRNVSYKQGKLALEGYLAHDDAVTGKRPAVLVVHDWMGISAETRRRVDMLAALGYVALAADVYGKGVRPTTPDAAGKQAGKWKSDRPGLRARVRAALDFLLERPEVDPARSAAMGYCFGGTAALELARSGAPVAGVISFHGGLATPTPGLGGFKGKLLVLHGADDPHVPAAEVASFEQEARDAGLDWQLIAYGGAVHAFTNPGAGTDKSKGAAYDQRADRRSWQAMQQFFAELFRAAIPAP